MQKFLIALFVLVSSVSFGFTWKAIYISGDDSINNFDQGREDLSLLFAKLGKVDEIHLSSSSSYISRANIVHAATLENIATAFRTSKITNQSEGCLIHMTSHGAKHQGFYLRLSGILTPRDFAALVNARCGSAPTVVLVSACYSGQFITEDIKGPNRIIMTAASSERPSFGCSADTKYTYWDGCLLEVIPQSQTWWDMEQKLRACISRKEAQVGAASSNPQAFFGNNTKNWQILK